MKGAMPGNRDATGGNCKKVHDNRGENGCNVRKELAIARRIEGMSMTNRIPEGGEGEKNLT